jgi:NADH dehydrogenase (ubiquinone) Fe-S protein 3
MFLSEQIKICRYLSDLCPKWFLKSLCFKDNIFVFTTPRYLKPLLMFLKMHTSFLFSQLVDLTAIDLLSKNPSRFQLVYNLLSIIYSSRLVLVTTVESKPKTQLFYIDSVTDLFSSANWLEREVWDMFGVFFRFHPDLRRILTDYGFDGFPLRKDFPLSGYVELRYDDNKKIIVYESLELSQDFRVFDLQADWC